ncbi:hypothetical protein ACF1CG_24135 [Streptomyces sp. NPDC014773]|uniref:hypothetical protein n=1 Tax=Streptomyces sp. NPDC014773 TaxID=3364908 RepID=UPI0036FA8588
MHAKALPTVLIHHEELADLSSWAVTADFTGPVNACSDGPLDVHDLVGTVAAQAGREAVYRTVPAGEEASPFSFDRHHAMSNARAKALGFSFSRTTG